MQMTNGSIKKASLAIGGAVIALVGFFGGFTYNEAGHMTHIRTIYGAESVATEVGWAWQGFGRAQSWKQNQTIQFSSTDKGDVDDALSVQGFRVTFLGNVDGGVEASTRFRLPQGEQFLKIAREYRTPENFYLTAIIPAVKETLQSSSNMMTADDYFAGGRSEYAVTFEDQLKNGQFLVKRAESVVQNTRQAQDIPEGADPNSIGQVKRSQFDVVKLTDEKGNYIRKGQPFRQMGVEVVEARIMDIAPNDNFKGRMVAVQQAQADLAVARQNRIKEEENKQLVIAKGEREVEEKRQLTMKDQVERTTQAQTDKELALIAAAKQKEEAIIQKDTAATQLETARLEAQRTKTLADAEAHAKKVVIEANGALEQKLEALVKINAVWANAAKDAKVPEIVMGGASDGSGARQSEFSQMMQMMGVSAAKQLSADLSVKK